MPKFFVTQHRDAIQYWCAIIDADSREEARDMALNDDCKWIDGGTDQFDDREIPIEGIEQVDDDAIIVRHTIGPIVHILTIKHKKGSDVTAHVSEDAAHAELARWVRTGWPKSLRCDLLSMTPEALIETYFERIKTSSYTITCRTISGAISIETFGLSVAPIHPPHAKAGPATTTPAPS